MGSLAAGGRFQDGAFSAGLGYVLNYLQSAGRGKIALDRLKSGSKTAAGMIEYLDKVDTVWTVNVDEKAAITASTNSRTHTITINPTLLEKVEFQASDGTWFKRSIEVTLGHELKHAYDIEKLGERNALFPATYNNAISYENRIARELDPQAALRKTDHRCCFRVLP
jgi:polysaccharide pyruvyl transferase WcaK-like protein